MAITSNSLKTSSFHILFILCMFLIFIPLVLCNVERSQERSDFLYSSPLGLDCLYEGEHSNATLVSYSGVFEFGLFTPDKKANNSRYLGIWYYEQSKAKIVVWVANRDKPLLGSNVSLVIEHGKAKLLDGKGVVYWSTGQVQTMRPANSAPTFNSSNITSPNELIRYRRPFNYPKYKPPPHNKSHNKPAPHSIRIRLCLKDNGNLVLDDPTQLGDPFLWQSFDYPTDTFLPDMSATSSLDLTCWQSHNNPAKGNFSFLLQPDTSNEWVINKGLSTYWRSRDNPFDKFALNLSQSGIPLLQSNTRFVMNSTGQFQFWKWENRRGWYLYWSEPKDKCSLENACGTFSICNNYSGVLCKCLPGFKATAKSGDASTGCTPISGSQIVRNDSLSETFFPLPMMAVGSGTCFDSTEENCSDACLKDYQCVAYSQHFDCSGASSKIENNCLMWKNELTNLQELYPDGITMYVRTTQLDIEPFPKGCRPCGAYIIPYPLSTGRNCGDPSYFNFHCNATTGQVNFTTLKGNFRVSSVDLDTRSFNIQVMHSTCDRRYINISVLSDKDSLPYTFRNCKVVGDRTFNQQQFIEVEIEWKQPPQPLCSASSDCNQWSHTTCKTTNEGKMRCVCGSKFHWNGTNMKCTREPFLLKVVIPCIAVALTVILVCLVFLVYHKRERRMAKGQGLLGFKADDIEGVDVPFFEWENIVAATSNFADANRLGIGGFGSVYLGKHPDGKEIAVKRLSNVSVQGVEEFRTEVMLIAKLQHRNLVKLLGYCTKADKKILVYEFMSNGSLDSSLFDEKHSVYLDWKKRFDIIVGIARGLLYLHQDSRLRIIHRDLKPSNILLDEELNPKISDFGIARIVGGKDTQASTGRVVGTYGYMSPEYAYEGIFSIKSDVFSFGVVILETISGRRNSRIFMFEHGLSLLGYAWKLWNEDKGLELLDPKLKELCFPSEVQKCIHIGLLCVQEDPSDRPTMSTVVYMLSGENASLPLAKQPAFMNRKPLSDTASSSSAKNLSMHEVMTVSTVGR